VDALREVEHDVDLHGAAGEASDEVPDAADPVDLVAQRREGLLDAGDGALVVAAPDQRESGR